MLKRSVVHVRIPPSLDTITYISLAVMSLLAINGLDSLQAQLISLALCTASGLLYLLVFKTRRYEQNPAIYFGPQFVLMVLLLLLRSSSVDAINFLFLVISLHAAYVLVPYAAVFWLSLYYLTVSTSVFIRSGTGGFYAAAFYLVAYVAMGFFGHILQQAELARAHNQRLLDELQSAQRQLKELAVVEERNRLARDLHDSVKQQVFAISMQLGAARTLLGEGHRAVEPVRQAEQLAQQAIAELNTLISELRPPGLESKPLPAAIQQYGAKWSRQNNIETEIKLAGNRAIDLQVEQVLFRVLQEALANVARHSRAGKVLILLQAGHDGVTLTIEDNGIGFDAATVGRGIGLDSMAERLQAVNGRLEVSSREGGGARIIAKVGSA